MKYPKAFKALSQILLAHKIKTDDDSCFAASIDNLRLSFLPEAVLFPEDESEVQAIVKLANEHRVPLTVRGGGTATTGSAAPVKGGWALDLSGWDQLHIDETSSIAYAQPGVKTDVLRQAAEAKGLFYPPDPSSMKHSTIGGNIACNAGGMHGAKYGVTRDYVLGLEGITPTGEWVRWAGDYRKYAAGYNMRDLWIGSEGTLGIITGAVLKLIPKPASKTTFLATFKNDRSALLAVRALLKRRLLPSILEFMDQQTVDCLLQKRFPLPVKVETGTPAPSVLLIELDGHADAVKRDVAVLKSLLKKRVQFLRTAKSKKEAEMLWEVRRKCSQAMFIMGNAKLNEDVVVPLDAQLDLIRFTLDLKAQTGLATPTFGHVGDGNFHVHVMFNRDDPVQLAKAEESVQAIMEKVVELGGAISGEHGIGLAKTPFYSLQHSEAEVAVMKSIKQAMDPNGILNPGKIFEPFRVWEHQPVTVKLAWDH